MTPDDPNRNGRLTPGGFLTGLAKDFLRSLLGLAAAFVIGTAAGAGICLYYGLPLIFSLAGGAVVLGIGVAVVAMIVVA